MDVINMQSTPQPPPRKQQGCCSYRHLPVHIRKTTEQLWKEEHTWIFPRKHSVLPYKFMRKKDEPLISVADDLSQCWGVTKNVSSTLWKLVTVCLQHLPFQPHELWTYHTDRGHMCLWITVLLHTTSPHLLKKKKRIVLNAHSKWFQSVNNLFDQVRLSGAMLLPLKRWKRSVPVIAHWQCSN